MTTKKRVARHDGGGSTAGDSQADPALIAFLKKLDHPLKPVVEAVRQSLLGADPAIREGIKWNAPSFHFKEYFATLGVRSRDFVHVVFYKGARVKDNATSGMQITDPAGLLEWHSRDRCSAKFHDMKDFKSKAAAQSCTHWTNWSSMPCCSRLCFIFSFARRRRRTCEA